MLECYRLKTFFFKTKRTTDSGLTLQICNILLGLYEMFHLSQLLSFSDIIFTDIIYSYFININYFCSPCSKFNHSKLF